MEALLLYLLKANVVLALFAAAYYGLLRRLTFFELNRAYLLLALVFAAVYPAVPMPALLPPDAAAPLLLPTVGNLPAVRVAQFGSPGHSFGWLPAASLGFYALGTGLLLLRLLGQLLSLALMQQRSQPAVVLGQLVRMLPGAGGPFSFGRTIYLSAASLVDAAGLPAVLRHEQAHVRQWHTLDVLLTQVAVAVAWANPAAWLLRRAVLDNLEYLADRAALQTGLDRRAYQYRLLHQQPGGAPVPALAFHFSFLTLKNRILMLNQPLSSTRQLGRYLLAAPLIMALALGYSSAQAQVVPTPAPAAKPLPANMVYYIDGQPADKAALEKIDINTMVANIQVLKSAQYQQIFGGAAPDGALIVTTKANVNSPVVAALNNRIAKVVPFVPATPEQEGGIAAAQAYIAKTYPNAKLNSIFAMKGQPTRYKATFTENGNRMNLLLDGNGQPVKQ